MTDPKQTIAYLDELQQLGFTDEAFWRLHHFRDKDKRDTIRSHKAYCEKTQSFRDGDNNARVQERLGIGLKYYKTYHTGHPAVFSDLAEAAYCLIPCVPF